jgi:hypothetical protein
MKPSLVRTLTGGRTVAAQRALPSAARLRLTQGVARLQEAQRKVEYAACLIQARVRGRKAREELRLQEHAARLIQLHVRTREAREDARLLALVPKNNEEALALELQKRVINGRRKALARRAQARRKAKLPLDSVICKVYPPKQYQLSENFDPTGALLGRASFICMNMQGRAKSAQAKLSADCRRGNPAGASNKCRRDKARSLEKLFLREGYDGYMRKDAFIGTQGRAMRDEFLRFLAAEHKVKSWPVRLWHTAYDKVKMRNESKAKAKPPSERQKHAVAAMEAAGRQED